MHLTWKPNRSTSALHTAEACWKLPQRLTDPAILEAMGPFARRLGIWISDLGVPNPQTLWDSLIATGAVIESNEELAQCVLSRSGRHGLSHTHTRSLAELVTDIEAAFIRLVPKYMDQIPLRLRPLQEQWLGFGQGLMTQCRRTTGLHGSNNRCSVIGVQPVLGGFGKCHWEHNLVRIEAVLTNPNPEIPEVVRLAWLLAQLEAASHGTTYPSISDASNPDIPIAWTTWEWIPLAMVSPILVAAHDMELMRFDPHAIDLALEHWHLEIPAHGPLRSELPQLLFRWWQSATAANNPWNESLQILANQLDG
jgi:hypothetical protein